MTDRLDVVLNIAVCADDATLYPKYYRDFHWCQQFELAFDFESDLREAVDCGKIFYDDENN